MKHKTINHRRHYDKIHKWLYYHYGKADKCDNPDCPKICKYFSWALKKGKELEKNRDNYIQLCYSCHTKYDFTEERKNYLSKTMKGKPASPQAYTALKKKLKGVPRTEEVKRKIRLSKLKRKERLGYVNSPETRKNMSIAQKRRYFNHYKTLKNLTSIRRN